MIILFVGGIGSGKSLTAARFIAYANQPCFTNFKVRSPNNHRLLWSDLIIGDKKDKQVNWKKWNDIRKTYGHFHVVIDELHNVMHSRRSMSKENVLLSQWVAQIRKVTGDSEKSHFIAISQEIERIDVSVRDLATRVVFMTKHPSGRMEETTVYKNGRRLTLLLPVYFIHQHIFMGTNAVRDYQSWRDTGTPTYTTRAYYKANNDYHLLDSYELIQFGTTKYV